MKKHITILALALACLFSASAQQAYWVFLADKAGTTFDPYTYFDAKAIERYQQCGADLYDITNYPVSAAYEQGVSALATEEIGASRWMNALGVMATPDQVLAIEALPYVLRVQPIEGNGLQLADCNDVEPLDGLFDIATVDGPLEAQLVRMGGKAFRDKGIDGKGVRIAVFDGGFPRVNTHEAFRHLRDNRQIIKTWNFPKGKEDVYGWNSHGTMTLSCIAGRMNGVDLGLATGAEFLLARTEINSEPFKEEVWWQMAVEWADKNGANIISSSLGYGKERHYTTDMDGTSYVARAGNLAARKGILVCNSAGNEGDDKQWKTIITPSDADSVLCIGGIENSLTEYNHIDFSSYGPSADGRMKPNVCAFGYARTANVSSDKAYHYVHGTSFSCPLVAGFAACAWQASPGKTAMQMFDLIQRSADLYPYADYSYGYGVPQAEFFTGGKQAVSPTFRFAVQPNGTIAVAPTASVLGKPVFYKETSGDGHIYRYGKVNAILPDTAGRILFDVPANRNLIVSLDGYSDSITSNLYGPGEVAAFGTLSGAGLVSGEEFRNPDFENTPSKWGSNSKYRFNFFIEYGSLLIADNIEMTADYWSPEWGFGFRFLRAFSKVYCLGLSAEVHFNDYNFVDQDINDLESSLGIAQTTLNAFDKVEVRRAEQTEWTLELFQRVRLRALGLMGNGLHWDLGVYGSYAPNSYTLGGTMPSGSPADYQQTTWKDIDALSAHKWNFGVSTRITYDWIGIYARLRLNGIGSGPDAGKVLLPRLVIGVQVLY